MKNTVEFCIVRGTQYTTSSVMDEEMLLLDPDQSSGYVFALRCWPGSGSLTNQDGSALRRAKSTTGPTELELAPPVFSSPSQKAGSIIGTQPVIKWPRWVRFPKRGHKSCNVVHLNAPTPRQIIKMYNGRADVELRFTKRSN